MFRQPIDEWPELYYSNIYEDDEYEYRHVHVSADLLRKVPKNRFLSEGEWRSLGIEQDSGWVHYMIHRPERHVLLFRRKLDKPSKQPDAVVEEGPKSVGVGA